MPHRPRARAATTHRARRALGLAAVTSVALAGCAGGHSLVLGTSYDRPGLGLRVLDDFSGFDSVLGRDIARRLGHPRKKDVAQVNVTERRAGEPGAGRLPYDLLVAAYPVTDALRARADLVGPYLQGRQDIAVRAQEKGPVTARSLAGRTVCVVSGSQVGRTAPTTFPGARIAYRDTLSTCLTDLRQGSVDAVSDEGLALRGYAAEAPFAGSVRVVGAAFPTVDYYIVVNRKDPDLCQKVKGALVDAIKDGSWARAYQDQLVHTGAVAKVPTPPQRITGCSS